MRSSTFDAWRRPALLAAIAALALATGTMVYLVDRAPGHALFLPHLGSAGANAVFGATGAWLPSFVHPLAFALLTAAVLPAASSWRYGGCVAWGAVNVAFELGQLDALKGAWVEAVARGVVPPPLARYFIYGSFDVADIVAVVAGALVAAALLHGVDRLKENEHVR